MIPGSGFCIVHRQAREDRQPKSLYGVVAPKSTDFQEAVFRFKSCSLSSATARTNELVVHRTFCLRLQVWHVNVIYTATLLGHQCISDWDLVNASNSNSNCRSNSNSNSNVNVNVNSNSNSTIIPLLCCRC